MGYSEYFGEIFNAATGDLCILELGSSEERILRTMNDAVVRFDPDQLYTEASDYVLQNVDRIVILP